MRQYQRLIVLVIGAATAFALWECLTSIVAYTDDAYVRSDLVTIAPQVGGMIVAVNVRDNQPVAAATELLTIDPVPFQLAIAQRQAEIDEARAQIADDQGALAEAEDADAAAAASLELARETQSRIATLQRNADAPAQRLDSADEALRQAQAMQGAAHAAIERQRSLAALHQAALAHAEADMALAQWRLARTHLTAQSAGTITNLSVRVGDTAQIDVPLVGIVDATGWRIIANYKQDYIRGFKDGQVGWVWLDSDPWHWHRARVSGVARGISRTAGDDKLLPYVAPTTDWIRLQRRFPVTLILDDPPPDGSLFMGADARVVIFP